MDIRGLRIGNIVSIKCKPTNNYEDNYCKIVSVDRATIIAEKVSGAWTNLIEPIPLSEDLLFKLGFKKEEEEVTHVYEYNLCANNHFIRIGKYSNTLGRDYNIHIDNQNRDSVSCTDIQYFHQLQNVIFDATGEELNVNELLK